MADAELWFLLVQEVLIGALLWVFLRARGWDLRSIGLQPGPNAQDIAVGLGLAVAGYVGMLIVGFIIALSGGFATEQPDVLGSGLGLAPAAAVSIFNAVYEEVFVCAYVVAALRHRADPWTVIGISAALRLLYHTYQGAEAVLTIVPFSMLFAYWFARTGRSWPLIVGHAAWDFFVMLNYLETY
jgi:membrane protease YdiL (CAAX protease family)